MQRNTSAMVQCVRYQETAKAGIICLESSKKYFTEIRTGVVFFNQVLSVMGATDSEEVETKKDSV